jgi:hypothetical protein
MSFDHAFHGWTLRAPMPLHSFAVAPRPSSEIVVVDWSADPLPDYAADDEACLAKEDRPDGTLFYRIGAGDAGYSLHMPEIVDFLVSSDLRRIDMWRGDDVDEAIVDVILGGILSATVIMLGGDLTLHASAVYADDMALAFVGQRGMGKSTMAAIMCRDGGARLISDDVLRVLPDPTRVFSGATAARLRGVWQDVDGGQPVHRETADERYALPLDSLDSLDAIPLGALAVPFPTRDSSVVDVERLAPRDALGLLWRFPRLPGWVGKNQLGQQFRGLAELVREVPVFAVKVPWGPPFAPGTADAVIEATLRSS